MTQTNDVDCRQAEYLNLIGFQQESILPFLTDPYFTLNTVALPLYLFNNPLFLLVSVKDFQKRFVYVWLVLKSILKEYQIK